MFMRSLSSLSVCIVARQWVSKHVPMATSTHTRIRELLDRSLCRPCSKGKKAISSFQMADYELVRP
jgi:hypothetical protein